MMHDHPWVREFGAAVTVCDAVGIILEMNDRDGQYAGFVEIVLSLPEVLPHFIRDGTT